jgi:solute carrier family 25 thiamine pyrophosphate transporter 19
MLAGSFATATTYPFDLLRTRFAMQGMTKVLFECASEPFIRFLLNNQN